MKVDVKKIVKLEFTEIETKMLIRLLNNYVETDGIDDEMNNFKNDLSDLLKSNIDYREPPCF